MGIESVGAVEGFGGKKIELYEANFDNSKMDQEGFLEVLLTSFKYQDPFETQDISKFIDNTVKLRELEIMNNFEKSVAALNSGDALFLSSTNMIGQDVLYKGDMLYVEDGKGYVEFVPRKNADSAELFIYDESGNVIAKKSFTGLKAGEKQVFEIEDENIEEGFYKVTLISDSDPDLKADIYSKAKVSAIEKDGYELSVVIGGERFKINDIVKIGG